MSIHAPHANLKELDKKVLSKFLDEHKEIHRLVVAPNYNRHTKNDNQDRLPHGTMANLKADYAVSQQFLPKHSGGCVALIDIKNFTPALHTMNLQEKTLNEKFLAAVGSGPTMENTRTDSFKMDLGRPKEEWSPYLGGGIIGIVVETTGKQWGNKHQIAIVLPDLPIAKQMISSICGKTLKEMSEHHYVDLLPGLIERNARKLATTYANTFGFEVEMDTDEMGPSNHENPTYLAKLSSFSFEPTIYKDDGSLYLCSKVLVPSTSRNAVIPVSPHRGLLVAELTSRHYLPFGVSATRTAKVQITADMQKHYGQTVQWKSKLPHSEIPEKLSKRVYEEDKCVHFLKSAAVSSSTNRDWAFMIYGKVK